MEAFIEKVAPYYHRYISLVPPGDILIHLKSQMEKTQQFFSGISEKDSLYAYAPGKWTIRELAGHLTDAERVFAYRAMRIARNDKTNLPGFEENEYVRQARFNEQKWPDLLHQLRTTREASLALFSSFNETELSREGTANDAPANVKALVYIVAGHELHHIGIVKERYLDKANV